MRASRILVAIAVMALCAVSFFGVLAYRAIDVTDAAPDAAYARFQKIRERFRDQTPMINSGAAGAPTRSPPNPAGKEPTRADLKTLEVIAYHADEQRLVTAHVPFWFLGMKAPGVQWAVRDTGLDLERLHLTPEMLRQHGPGLILDQAATNGDRLLVWIE